MSLPFAQSPAKVVRKLLIDTADIVEGPTTQWSSFLGFMPEESDAHDDIVVFSDDGSIHQGRAMSNGYVYERFVVQITVRSNGYETGRIKLEAINKQLDAVKDRQVVIGSDDYYDAIGFSRESGPLYLGVEREGSKKRKLWTQRFSVSIVVAPPLPGPVGTLGFDGAVFTTDTGNLGTADAITSLPDPEISSATGDFSGHSGLTVDIVSALTFDPADTGVPYTFMTYTTSGVTYVFTMVTVTVAFQASFILSLSGTCTLSSTQRENSNVAFTFTGNAGGYSVAMTMT